MNNSYFYFHKVFKYFIKRIIIICYKKNLIIVKFYVNINNKKNNMNKIIEVILKLCSVIQY